MPHHLPPVEQCGGDAQFSLTRRQLEKAVAGRDLHGLVSLMANDVRISFGGGLGKEAFVQRWTATRNEQAQLWKELDRALRLGCVKAVGGSGHEYRAMPAMFVTGGDLDGFSTWVALPGSVARSHPRKSASVTAHLAAWTVLEDVEHDGGDWIEVRTRKGSRGFVSITQARSLLDYRITFGRRDGAWRITAFVAGD
jgi:hypothetical protein